MPNWLTKATGALSRQAEEEPQTFQVTCECSERHSGQRKSRPQRIICQTCGAALFVLPKNVYPPVKDRPARKNNRKPRRSDGPPTGPGVPTAQEMASSVRKGVAGAAGGVRRGMGAAGAAVRRKTTSAVTGTVQAVREFFTPFRIVVAGIVVMLLTTGYLAVRSHSHELARVRLRDELEAGQQSLAEDDLSAARSHFEVAAAAVETLGTSDALSQLVRQLHRETTAMTGLAPGSLFEMLEECDQAQTNTGVVSWEAIFSSRYEGTWFVLQAPVRRNGDTFQLDFPLTVGERRRPATVEVDLPHFRRLNNEQLTGALFAAPVVRCELDEAKEQWTVTLDGETGFLWSDSENLRRLGFFEAEWVDEEAVVELLKGQTELSRGML